MAEKDKKTEQTKGLTPHWASPDDPIYTRGYVIGGYYSARSFKRTPETESETKKEPMTIEEEYEEAMLKLLKKTQEKLQ